LVSLGLDYFSDNPIHSRDHNFQATVKPCKVWRLVVSHHPSSYIQLYPFKTISYGTSDLFAGLGIQPDFRVVAFEYQKLPGNVQSSFSDFYYIIIYINPKPNP
jgi:hypothetical protein